MLGETPHRVIADAAVQRSVGGPHQIDEPGFSRFGCDLPGQFGGWVGDRHRMFNRRVGNKPRSYQRLAWNARSPLRAWALKALRPSGVDPTSRRSGERRVGKM